jgi:hypothetical protein
MSTELLIEPHDQPSWSLQVESPLVAIAGFTGRDPGAVCEHIRELREIGVPEPHEVPSTYAVPDWVLVQPNGDVQVSNGRGSGEAEPVIVAMPDGKAYVTVGSDHTDRDLERTSIELAKRAHPKILAHGAWPFSDVEDHWDELILRSWAGEEGKLYQEDRLAVIAPPLSLVEQVRSALRPPRDRPLIVFLGTVPLRGGGFRFDGAFRATLEDPRHNRELACAYKAVPIGASRPTPVT